MKFVVWEGRRSDSLPLTFCFQDFHSFQPSQSIVLNHHWNQNCLLWCHFGLRFHSHVFWTRQLSCCSFVCLIHCSIIQLFLFNHSFVNHSVESISCCLIVQFSLILVLREWNLGKCEISHFETTVGSTTRHQHQRAMIHVHWPHPWITNNDSWTLLFDCIHCWISEIDLFSHDIVSNTVSVPTFVFVVHIVHQHELWNPFQVSQTCLEPPLESKLFAFVPFWDEISFV